MQNLKSMICKPMGGLNDILCQIEKCRIYARISGRVLFVDTRDTHFGESLDNHIISIDHSVQLIPDDFQFYSNSTYPPLIKSYRERPIYDEIKGGYYHINSDHSFTLDLSKDYEEDVVIYQGHGGGNLSHNLVSSLRYADCLSAKVVSIRNQLPDSYIGVHLRGTDFVASNELETAMTTIRNIARSLQRTTVFLCTDSKIFLKTFVSECLNAQVFSFSANISASDLPKHQRSEDEIRDSKEKIKELNEATFIDLASLSLSSQVISPLLSSRGHSGFGKLAEFLNLNPIIRKSFIGC